MSDVVVAVHAGYARPGQHRDRKAGGKRDQEHCRRVAGREHEEDQRQQRRSRHRPDEADDGVHPITDGTGPAAQFNRPISVAVDRTGNVFVTDSFNTVRQITADGTVTTVAATASAQQIAPDGQLIYPSGVAVDATGNLYIADNGSNALHKGVPASQYASLTVTAAK